MAQAALMAQAAQAQRPAGVPQSPFVG